MEQNLNDKPLSNMQIARYIESLRKEMNFDDEVYGLVKSDLEDGLTQEQTEKYLDKNFNIGQMRVLSEGLHKEIPEELFNILHNNKLSGNQMKVSLEFYEKGVPVETIQEAVARGEKPVVMRRLYEEVLAQLSKAAEQYTQDSEYVKELIAQMEMVVEKINYQEERYDALNKKLSDVEVLKEDKEVTERLVKENEDKDGIISHQQDELNKAMYIGLMCNEDGYDEPFGDVTVNLSVAAPNYCGYLNVNDMPDIEKFITENELGEFTGFTQRSGYCECPLYLVNVDKLRELCPDGMDMY